MQKKIEAITSMKVMNANNNLSSCSNECESQRSIYKTAIKPRVTNLSITYSAIAQADSIKASNEANSG